ncbi:MAG: hypothetical protein V2B14_05210 [bacterium]
MKIIRKKQIKLISNKEILDGNKTFKEEEVENKLVKMEDEKWQEY